MAESTNNIHRFTDSNKRCLKCVAVVLEVFPKILQRIMEHSGLDASWLYTHVLKTKSLKKQLTPPDHQMLKTLLSEGYRQLDMSLMCKIISYYNSMFVEPPTRGWKSNPMFNEIEIGDDIQRLRLTRNKLLHKTDNDLSEQESDDFFSGVTSICERIDQYLNCTKDESFTLKVQQIKRNQLDNAEKIQQEYDKTKHLEEFFVVKIGENMFKVLKAKSLREFLQQRKEDCEHQQGNAIPITLTFHDMSDADVERIMAANLEDLKQGNIIVKSISRGSLVLYIDIPEQLLLNDKLLEDELTMFLKHISRQRCWENYLKTLQIVSIVISGCDAYSAVKEDLNMGDNETIATPGSLILNLEVEENVLQSGEMLKEKLECLMLSIIERSVGHSGCWNAAMPIVSVVEPSVKGFTQTVTRMEDNIYINMQLNKDKDIKRFCSALENLKQMRSDIIRNLIQIRDDITEQHKRHRIGSIAYASTGIVGGGLMVAGIILSPFTFGTSIGLTIAGAAVSTASTGASITHGIAKHVIIKQKCTEADQLLQKYRSMIKEFAVFVENLLRARANTHSVIEDFLKSSEGVCSDISNYVDVSSIICSCEPMKTASRRVPLHGSGVFASSSTVTSIRSIVAGKKVNKDILSDHAKHLTDIIEQLNRWE